MMQIDLPYLCITIGNLSGVPVRIYEGENLTFYYSQAYLPRDPMVVYREQIFAVVTKVRRKEKWIGPGDFWWEFFRKPWIRLLPIRRGVIGVYGFFRRRG